MIILGDYRCLIDIYLIPSSGIEVETVPIPRRNQGKWDCSRPLCARQDDRDNVKDDLFILLWKAAVKKREPIACSP